ncbi:hypothetical protein E2C01_050479 [Portunus trituberculatus]|uniref:Uncharacterized protein n=1 Tax=Portunus trituberculatus TaxID=210409 RepID=A0A5B7GGV9_PORTR|nr:hypothetical protein [Portunus trituberculatus]
MKAANSSRCWMLNIWKNGASLPFATSMRESLRHVVFRRLPTRSILLPTQLGERLTLRLASHLPLSDWPCLSAVL